MCHQQAEYSGYCSRKKEAAGNATQEAYLIAGTQYAYHICGRTEERGMTKGRKPRVSHENIQAHRHYPEYEHLRENGHPIGSEKGGEDHQEDESCDSPRYLQPGLGY